jgi:DNA-binding XRE family transcriptional regulator
MHLWFPESAVFRIDGNFYETENATSSRFRSLEAILLAVQCRMARTALGWSVKDLSTAARVSTNTIVRLERGELLKPRTVGDIREALEKAGVTFIDGEYAGSGGPGVRLTSDLVS